MKTFPKVLAIEIDSRNAMKGMIIRAPDFARTKKDSFETSGYWKIRPEDCRREVLKVSLKWIKIGQKRLEMAKNTVNTVKNTVNTVKNTVNTVKP